MPLQFQILICHKYLLNRKGVEASITVSLSVISKRPSLRRISCFT